MANKHTSGSWDFEFSKTGFDVFSGAEHIASVKQTVNNEQEQHAKLIAAAPDMLAALLILRDRINRINTGFYSSNGIISTDEVFRILYGQNELNNAIEKATK